MTVGAVVVVVAMTARVGMARGLVVIAVAVMEACADQRVKTVG